MAKSKEKPSSKSAYFRQKYTDHPELLDRDNEEMLALWHKDNPSEEVTQQVRNSLANVKSQLRKKAGMPRRRKRRRKGAAAAGAPAAAAAEPRATRPRASLNALEELEGHIDECLMLAHKHNSEGLENVIKHLRQARREVAWGMRQPAGARE